MVLPKSKKYLIDTNILVYSINKNSDFHTQTNTLLQKLINQDYQLYTSTQNLLEFERIITHPIFNKLIDYRIRNKQLDFWINNLNILHEDKIVWLKYLELRAQLKPIGNKIFDIWLASIAISNGIHYIVTANEKDFTNIPEIKIYNPCI